MGRRERRGVSTPDSLSKPEASRAPRASVEKLAKTVAMSASRVYEVATMTYGLDPEGAANSEPDRAAAAPLPARWSAGS